jgi:dTDP-4-amino-4,6-dideoxygalactose transaminase
MDVNLIEALITPATKVIVPVHYAGIACDMEAIMELAKKYNLLVIEDAAQAIDSYYVNQQGKKMPLGSIGHMAAFSFHETKNIIAGEGGMLAINDKQFIDRAEVIWEKGTNRTKFFRGEVDKYGWIDIGSSFLPSEVTAAFLWAQLENLDLIQNKRIKIWNTYFKGLKDLSDHNIIGLSYLPQYATNNAHIFYIILKNIQVREALIAFLKSKQILPVFHYLSLHSSPFYKDKHDGRVLTQTDRYSDCLLRLPFYYDLQENEVNQIVFYIHEFFNINK